MNKVKEDFVLTLKIQNHETKLLTLDTSTKC